MAFIEEVVGDYWRAMLVTLAGWLVCGWLLVNNVTYFGLVLVLLAGLLLHLLTFTALRAAVPELNWLWLFIIGGLWSLAVSIFYALNMMIGYGPFWVSIYAEAGVMLAGVTAGALLGFVLWDVMPRFSAWRILLIAVAWAGGHIAIISGSPLLMLTGGGLATLVLFWQVATAERLRWGEDATLADIFANPDAYTPEKPKPRTPPRRFTLTHVVMLLCGGAALLLLWPGESQRLGLYTPNYRNEPTPVPLYAQPDQLYRIVRAPEGVYSMIGLTGYLLNTWFDDEEFVWMYLFNTTDYYLHTVREWQIEPYNRIPAEVTPESTAEVLP